MNDAIAIIASLTSIERNPATAGIGSQTRATTKARAENIPAPVINLNTLRSENATFLFIIYPFDLKGNKKPTESCGVKDMRAESALA